MLPFARSLKLPLPHENQLVVTLEPEHDLTSTEVYFDDAITETLQIEQRLRDAGYAVLPEVLRMGGDFDFEGDTISDVLEEARSYLLHQQTIDLAGARILATLGELAVKAQAFDAIVRIHRKS